VVEGAAVRVSLVCFAGATEPGETPYLDGEPVIEIFPDLTARDITTGIDLTNVNRLLSNFNRAFQGPVKVGPFDIPGDLARHFLQMPTNPNGRPNTDVVKPWANGMDITRRASDTWIIDFGEMAEAEACLYEAPFEYVRANIKPLRAKNWDRQRRENWWRLGRSGNDFKTAIGNLSRFIITPRLAKYRLFVWTPARLLPDCQLVAIAREDDTTFGILHSRLHEIWALRLGTSLEDRPRYTSSTTFETFPFPEGLTPDIPAVEYASDPRAQKITTAAKRLDQLRNNWLNPPDLIMSVPEVVKGYPDRILPKDEAAAQVLKQRTLTNLYNERPSWLNNAHRDLDAAVADAYGWTSDMSDDELLTKLLALNLERIKKHQ